MFFLQRNDIPKHPVIVHSSNVVVFNPRDAQAEEDAEEPTENAECNIEVVFPVARIKPSHDGGAKSPFYHANSCQCYTHQLYPHEHAHTPTAYTYTHSGPTSWCSTCWLQSTRMDLGRKQSQWPVVEIIDVPVSDRSSCSFTFAEAM